METKRCPYCGEEILLTAKKCKHCKEWLDTDETEVKTNNTDATHDFNSGEDQSTSIEQEFDEALAATKKKRTTILTIICVVIIGLIFYGIKSCKDQEREDAETYARDKADYDEWFDEHSCAGIDYRNYAQFRNYIQAVLDKNGKTTFSAIADNGKVIKIVFYGNSNNVHLEDEDGDFVDGSYKVLEAAIYIYRPGEEEPMYHMTYDKENPESFKELIYIKSNDKYRAYTITRN
jgi:hypothetical protein